jgi:hypothetical protein
LDADYANANMALAKVYARSTLGEPEFSRELGISWKKGYAEALRYLNRGISGSNVDYHLLRSWVALRKYQHERAIDEARLALELSPNDSEALEALAKALIYAGRPEEGMQFAQSAMRQNPTSPGTALYLLGLGEFALGHPDRTIELVERALKHAPFKIDFGLILAAAYGELGRVEQARAALEPVSRGWELLNREVDLAGAVWFHPFIEESIMERLANGIKLAGARSGLGGYVPLKKENRLKGSEIESLLFGKEIKGFDYVTIGSWSQQRTDDGTVKHFGTPIQPGVQLGDKGISRVDEDMLCERWPNVTTNFDMCVVIYRMPEGKARVHWGDYVMLTVLGPQAFSVVE